MISSGKQREAGEPQRRAGGDQAEPPSYLLFEVGGREYSIEVGATEGVVDCPGVCPLPTAPEGVIGIASVRGRMTVVFDLSRESGVNGNKQKLVLIRGDARLGLVADRVHGVVAPAANSLSAYKGAKELRWPVKAAFKLGDRRVGVLDVERLLEA